MKAAGKIGLLTIGSARALGVDGTSFSNMAGSSPSASIGERDRPDAAPPPRSWWSERCCSAARYSSAGGEQCAVVASADSLADFLPVNRDRLVERDIKVACDKSGRTSLRAAAR